MAKKTNKTSHVLDLLTNGTSSETGSTAGASARTTIPKKVTVVDEASRNDRLSQEILNSLSEELGQEVPQETDEAFEEETAASASVSQPDITPDTSTAEEPAEVQAPAPQAGTLPPADDSTIAELRSPFGRQKEDGFHFLNVMEQLLMQQDLDGLLKRYNVCTCRRCKADVCALTLTALPSKYVVISKTSLSPVLNYYENKFKISMLTELSKACAIVWETPHHSR